MFQLYRSPPETRSRPAKRNRIENPLATFLSDLVEKPSQRAPAYRHQVLFFLLNRHWKSFDSEVQGDIRERLLYFLSKDSDPLVQTWSLLCLSTICFIDESAQFDWTSTLR